LVINIISTYIGHLYAHHQEIHCVPLPIVVCPVVAVVMLESRVAVGSPDDGHKDARNMLR